MFYREAGDFKTSYRDDNQTFPIRLDRAGYWIALFVAFCVIPFFVNDYWVNSIFAPFFIYAIAALGSEHSDGLCRSGLAGYGWLHGRRRLCLL